MSSGAVFEVPVEGLNVVFHDTRVCRKIQGCLVMTSPTLLFSPQRIGKGLDEEKVKSMAGWSGLLMSTGMAGPFFDEPLLHF